MIGDHMLPSCRSHKTQGGSTGVFLVCLVSAILLVLVLVPPIVASDNGPDTVVAPTSSQAASYTLSDPQPSYTLTSAQADEESALCLALAYGQPFQRSWLNESIAGQRAEIVSVGTGEAVVLCRQ